MIRRLFSFLLDLTSHIGDIMDTKGFGPSNPRDWDPNHPQLTSQYAPHETGAVLRAHRAGKSAKWIAQNFKMSPNRIMNELRIQMGDENTAHSQNRPIYDGATSKRIIQVRNLDEERRQQGDSK
ncbi:hypothetical protein SEA_LAMBERT1_67 [Mycobacterium phage Lambert1]|nr:hypothetical protein SEA_TEXAGE_65 [Mycobacterium phage Texage]AUX82362.1 hypothetical protein SEA_LAMBERT1_67 [Mycobacterium phage Lambert1]QBP32276.1 hypothetical protein SEA_NOELLA_67 [Mycobacterium phage Noella]UVK64116.1 hypothetical protein SEA_CAVIAR_67 [Mycobacterium phage Caviar]